MVLRSHFRAPGPRLSSPRVNPAEHHDSVAKDLTAALSLDPDIIDDARWRSSPCPTHSRLAGFLRHWQLLGKAAAVHVR